MDRSPVEVAVLVIAGLIDGSERRAEAMTPLSHAVSAAVEELDPAGERDMSPTWWREMDPWRRLDACDRLRLSHDNLLLLESQASDIIMGLRAMLTPHAGQFTYRADHDRLCRMADQRAVHLDRMRLAEKRLRPKLTSETSALLSGSRRALLAEERRGKLQRARLGSLLSMADLVIAS